MKRTIILFIFSAFVFSGLTRLNGQVIFQDPDDIEAILNESFSFTPSVVSSPDAATFSLTAKPSWVSLANSATGQITGTPTAMTQGGLVTYQAVNSAGTFTKTFYLSISNAVECDADVIAYWKLDEENGPNFTDYANSYTATMDAGASYKDSIGKVGRCQVFNASDYLNDKFLTVTDNNQFEWSTNDDFSISFWFRSNGQPNDNVVLMGRVGDVSNGMYWWIGFNYTNQRVHVEFRDSEGPNPGDPSDTRVQYFDAGNGSLNPYGDNNWHYVCFVYKGSSSEAYMRVDGTDKTHSLWAFSGTANFSGTDVPLTIGHFDYAATYAFNGAMDDIIFYDRALTTQEVADIYADGQNGDEHCKPGSHAPIITSTPTTTASEGVLYSYDLNYREIDGDVVTLSAPTKPDWLNFNTSTGVLSATPTDAEIGSHPIVLQVADEDATLQQSFTLVVSNVNDVPVITSTPVTAVNEDAAYTYTITATDDDPGDVLTYSAPVKPTWLNFNASTRVLSGTPTNDQVGTNASADFDVTLRVNDGTVDVDQEFTITVTNINDLPVINSYDPFVTNEDVDIEITLSSFDVTDPDDVFPDDFTLTVLDGDHYSPVGNMIVIDDNWYGTLTVPIRLNDGKGTIDYDVSVTVNPVNDPPVISSSPITTASEGTPYLYNVVASDADPTNTLTYTAIKKPTWLNFNAGSLFGTPGNDDVGIDSVVVRVSDGTVNVDQKFTINVGNVNSEPYFTHLPGTSADDYVLYEDSIVADDPDVGDILTITIVTKPSWLLFNSNSGVLSGTPKYNHIGSNTLTFKVSDGTTEVQQTVNINVANTNTPPEFTTEPNTLATQGALYTYMVTATDVDEDDLAAGLTYTALVKPQWLNFNATTKTFSGTPDNDAVSATNNVIIRVSDGKASSEQDFNIDVTNVNDAPTFTSTAVTSVDEDAAYSYTATATDIDPDDVITLSAPQLPAWLTFNATTGVLSGTPTNDNVGNHNITLRASDGSLNTDQTFVISVANTNDAPYFTSTAPTAPVNEDGVFAYTVTVDDDDAGDNPTVTATQVPAWLTLTSGILSGTPEDADVGSHNIILTVSDGTASTNQTFTITVNGINDAPIIEGQNGTYSLRPEESLNITLDMLDINDPDNTAGELTLFVNSGSNYSVDGNTVTASANASGEIKVNVRVSDGIAASNTFEFTITINTAVDLIVTDLSRVYPNPARDFIRFELNNLAGETTITLFDVSGRLVAQQQVENEQLVIFNVEELNAGLYQYSISNKGRIQTGLISVNR